MNQIYVSYLRPLLEYAAIVLDECIQYEAARLVTGLTRSVSIEKLVKEIDWLSLSDRRNLKKLVAMFKIKKV